MKIAILGTRGIPANYGGFETFAEECAAGLAARGHEVTVYGRSHYVPRELRSCRGVRLTVLPTLPWKYTDTVVHTLLSVFHAAPRRFDVILICNAANSIFAWVPRIFGTRVVVNVDGIERLRRKWNRLGRAYYRLSEFLSTLFPNEIVTDARCIEQYYRDAYGARSEFIPYGASTEIPAGASALEELGLSPREYFLYVSRLEPENNAHILVKAFEKVNSPRKLVVVGSAPYAREYIRRLKETRDPRILFPGAIYGLRYRQLMANALCYVHATDVGGSHPALIEAMGLGSVIVANAAPENTEVLGGTGILYNRNDVSDLAARLQLVNDHPEEFAHLRDSARKRAGSDYSWDSVVDKYERLFTRLVGQRPRPAGSR
jgi:glycosyltransferase involved in cell wall biosynthesis